MTVYGKVGVAGIAATVLSGDECELADVVLCVRKGMPSPFDDNLEGECSRCGHAVIFRPYIAKAPPKVCTACAIDELAGQL